MNNKVIVGVVVGVVVLLAAGFLLMRKPQDNTSMDNSGNPSQQQPTNPSSPAARSLKDLIGLGSAQKCSYSAVSGEAGGQWVIYIANGKMRGDFGSTSAGQTMTSHMIADTQNTYIWSEGQTQGIKYSGSSAASVNEGINLDQQNNYNCSSWSADSKVFTPPTNVTFMDMSQLQKPPGQ